MSLAQSEHTENGAGRDQESAFNVSFPESSSQACALTSTSQSDNVSTEHLSWASLIKEQHRHLQAAVQSSVSGSGSAVTSMSPSSSLTASAPPSSYQEELKAWRHTLTGEAAAQRLTAYAEAMHNLATLYWNPSSTPLPGHCIGVDDGGRASGEPAAHGGSAATSASTAPRLGEKRKRSSDTADGVQELSSVLTEKAMPAVATATISDTNTRHYSDRLGYCLQSVASYYLGEADTEGCGEGTADGALKVADGKSSASVQSFAHPCFRVYIEQMRFRQLPGVFARVVKPLRRLFFQRYGRMATEAEVGQLIRVCTPPGDSSYSVLPNKSSVGCSSFLPYSIDSSGGSTTEVCAVRGLIDEDVNARAIVEESTWRRGENTAWATALYSIRDALHPTRTSAPTPLWTLDVGSCYGPFFGRVLSRAAPLPPVPLHVTSMDLAPYQGAAGCDNGSNGASSPRVWRADWLQMEFFADAAACEGSAAVAFGTAEEGRIRYQRQNPANSLNDGGGESKLCPCDSHDGCVGSTAQSSLAATAVRLESYDAVYFCLLLSYIPTPRLRFLACIHAFLTLKEGGLLVIVSTRTQGPRRRNWMSEWTTCLASIGFQRVQQSIQEKLVGMSFAKVSPSAEVRWSWATAEGRAAWIDSLMSSSAGQEGLRITADDARSRADI
ncbi:hypothetical protein, conserved [Leishmania tarentolae]|uniref:Probable methyltransferase BMT2 homolog n=1 Tax=Leishmania tarentolae TaxID=5689 RepID=A0A640KGU8_LEITA|nr:hypothetical protein, conserved [Leishmania tarentolae]